MANKELLRVYCFRKICGDFTDMKAHMRGAARHASEFANRTGFSPPIAFLSNEESLSCHKFISGNEALTMMRELQKLLPDDIWSAAAINIYQMDKEPSNMGYLFTREDLHSQPKRLCRDGDYFAMKNFDHLMLEEWMKAWRKRSMEMQVFEEPFLSVAAPNGIALEYRICADAAAKPLVNDPKMISIVSAAGIADAHMRGFSGMRMGIVVNDSRKIRLVALPKGAEGPRLLADVISWHTGIVSICEREEGEIRQTGIAERVLGWARNVMTI